MQMNHHVHFRNSDQGKQNYLNMIIIVNINIAVEILICFKLSEYQDP